MFLFCSQETIMSVAELADFRRVDGRFAKGRSGNPAGRPKGSRNRSTLLADALIEERAEPITAKVIEAAEGGDRQMLRLLFRAIVAPARDAVVELDVAEGKELDFEEALRVTARALFDGEITPDQALRIGRFISLSVRIAELKSRQAYREAKLRLEAQRQAAPPAKRQYFSREKAPQPRKAEAPLPGAARGEGDPVSVQYFSRELPAATTGARLRKDDEAASAPVSDQYFLRPRGSTALAGSMAAPAGLHAEAAMG
jgi:hypothetical protein